MSTGNNVETPGPDCRRALAAAAEWRLLGLLFERPRSGWEDEIRALGHDDVPEDLRAAAAAGHRAREAEYLEVFGPGGLVSPREVAYRGHEDPGHLLGDLAVFHDVFAFHPEREDPLDHVAVEAGLVGYLYLKEAYARSQGDVDAAQTAASAACRFVEAHLRWFAQPLAERLEAVEAPEHLRLAGRALLARTGPAPEARAGSAPVEADCSEFDCGGCAVPAPEPLHGGP